MVARPVLPVPLCPNCLGGIRKKFWIQNIAMLPIAVFAAWLVAQIPARIDIVGQLMITVFLGCLFTAVGFVIIDAFLRPYHLGNADRASAVGKIRFKNPAYTALLIRKIAQSDGIN